MARRTLLAAGSTLVLALTLASTAQAQRAPAVEEVVVTAQKREQPISQVPIAITALTGQRLDQLGVRDLSDMALFTPGLRVQDQSPNNPGYAIRGITSDDTNVFQEPRISIFQDGVSIAKAQASYVELFDIDRVEVARGPQTTLFGRAALIGGVNIIQNKAALGQWSAWVHEEAGDDGYRMGEGYVNAPLGEAFALRLSGRVRQRDGYVENAIGPDLQSVDARAGRIALKYSPDSALNVDLIGNYEEDHPTGTAFKSMRYVPTDPTTGAVLGTTQAWTTAALAAPPGMLQGRGLGIDRQVGGATLLVDYKLNSAWTLHSITAFRSFISKEVLDADGLSLPVLTVMVDSHGHDVSQELRLNYDDGGRVKGFAGVNVLRTQNRQSVPLQFDERISLADLTGQLSASPLTGFASNRPAPISVFANPLFTGQLVQGVAAALSGNRLLIPGATARAIAANLDPAHVEASLVTSDTRAADVFADISFQATDQLELTGGVRYSHTKAISGYGASVYQRSILGGVIGAAQLAGAGQTATAQSIVGALALPNARVLPASVLPLFALTDQPTPNNGDVGGGSITDEGLAWRLAARYQPSSGVNLYATYARGRRPPVASPVLPGVPGAAAGLEEIPAETVDSFEVGGKFALMDRRLRTEVAIYDYDYKNFQTIEQRGSIFLASNAGKARAYGVETQATWAVTDTFDVYATYAYSRGRFRSGAYRGNHFRLSPDHSASVALNWRFPAFGGEVSVRPSFAWQSTVYFADNNDRPDLQQPPNALVPDNVQDEMQKPYGVANLRISWSLPEQGLTLAAFANNVLDKRYIIDAGNTGDYFGLPTAIAGPPRLIGVGFAWRYR